MEAQHDVRYLDVGPRETRLTLREMTMDVRFVIEELKCMVEEPLPRVSCGL